MRFIKANVDLTTCRASNPVFKLKCSSYNIALINKSLIEFITKVSMQQNILPIRFDDSYNAYDFIVSSCNVEAYNAILKIDALWPSNRLLIIGEEGSGKTHLLRIWQELIGATHAGEHIDIINGANLIVDDIEQYMEKELLHIINTAEEKSVRLLMTASRYNGWVLPDLKSRINATYQVMIKPPDETFIPSLLSKMFSDQQIVVQPEVLDYIAVRIERSFYVIKRLFDHLNKMSMKDKRSITIPFVRSLLMDLELM